MKPLKGSGIQAAGQTQGWQKGPLPPGTYFWGGVVTKEHAGSTGFQFADFCGDHVKIQTFTGWERAEADQVVWYNNSLNLPPEEKDGDK